MNAMIAGNFKINGAQFSAQDMKINYESLNSPDTGRTDDGVMRLYWVKRRVRKISITLPPMTANELAQIFSKVQGVEYQLTYFDPLSNGEKTINCYTSNSSTDVYNGIIRNGLFQGATFNAIEVDGE